MKQTTIQQPEFKSVIKGETIADIDIYLAKNVQYPEGQGSFGLIGTVVIEFMVTRTGELTDYRVINSVSREIDEQVIKVLTETDGKWTPGILDGKPVDMKKEVYVVFKPNANFNIATSARKFQEKATEQLLVENNPNRALKSYNRAISLLPYEESLLAARSLCRYELGDIDGARQDWDRIIDLYKSGNPRFQAAGLDPAMQHLKGYAEMKQLLK